MKIDIQKLEGQAFNDWLAGFAIECTTRILRELLASHPGPSSTYDIRIVWLVTGAIHQAFEPELGIPVGQTLMVAMDSLTKLLSRGFAKPNVPPTGTVQ